MEKNLVLESFLISRKWGILDMYILLTEDTVIFDDGYQMPYSLDAHVLREQLSIVKGGAPIDIKLDWSKHQDLFLSLLMTRCPVSTILL